MFNADEVDVGMAGSDSVSVLYWVSNPGEKELKGKSKRKLVLMEINKKGKLGKSAG